MCIALPALSRRGIVLLLYSITRRYIYKTLNTNFVGATSCLTRNLYSLNTRRYYLFYQKTIFVNLRHNLEAERFHGGFQIA